MKSLPSFSNKPWLKYLAITAASFAALQHAQAQVFFINAGNSPGGSYNVFEAPLAGGPVPTKDFISLPGFGMSLATYGNDLFVGEGSPNNVLEYNIQSGQEIGSFAASDPVGLAVINNTLYVENRGTGISAATANGTIVGYSLTNPSVSATVASGLFEPQALAAHNGDLYVGLDNGGGSGTSGTIEALTPLGTAAPGFTTISGLSEPEGISFSNGNLLVTDNGGPYVGEYNASTGASVNPQFIKNLNPGNPYGISVLPNGNIVFAEDGSYGPIAEYTSTGTLVTTSFLTGQAGPNTGLTYPTALASTPEPSSWAMVALGLGVMAVLYRHARLRARV